MSIIVKDLTKVFGTQVAVDGLNFEMKKGEIVGFLGPNGAGKSTTMKMLTSYILPSSGDAIVNGYSILENPMEVKKSIGYLPEHNPLYSDMYVREYLQFIGEMQGVKDLKARIDEMIDLVGLNKEAHKKIGVLSKGYRQRVGLAQAMIHNPEVLILDEPTSGLDPNQLEDIRALIKKIGKEKTVMLSTHIMQEVEAICDRIIIIKNGKMVANDASAALKKDSKQTLFVEFDMAVDVALIKAIKSVTQVVQIDTCSFKIESEDPGDFRKTMVAWAKSQELSLLEIRREEKSLEEAFKDLTK